jgi:hypothetical protein
METEECGDLRIGDENDISAIAAVATVRTREGFELLSTHGNTSVAAVAGAKVQRHLVNKSCHDDCSLNFLKTVPGDVREVVANQPPAG